jgi:hypothetical protein
MKLRQAMDIQSNYHDDPGVSMPSRAIGLSAKTKGKKKEVKAGGPGSGRNPVKWLNHQKSMRLL